jgi:hypothetical protein
VEYTYKLLLQLISKILSGSGSFDRHLIPFMAWASTYFRFFPFHYSVPPAWTATHVHMPVVQQTYTLQGLRERAQGREQCYELVAEHLSHFTPAWGDEKSKEETR